MSYSSDVSLPNVYVKKVDVTNPMKVEAFVNEVKPHVIINAAGMTDVDRCEDDPETAFRLNALGPQNISKAANKVGARLLHISTDYVFGGEKGEAYREGDKPNPINMYGKTKLQGETEIASRCTDYLIARSSSIYGWHWNQGERQPTQTNRPLKFVALVIRNLREGKPVRAFTDQYSTPTLADSLASTLVKLAQSTTTGILNIAGRDCLNRFRFSELIAETFQLDSSLLVQASSAEFKQRASRPKRSCLDCSRAKEVIGYEPVGARDGLRLMRNQETTEVRKAR